MPVIAIEEQQKTDTGFEATLRFEGEQYSVTITEPFTSKQEKELEWYFEEWIRFPLSDTAIAQRISTSIKTYGEQLFNQVFVDKDAYSEYQQLQRNLSQLQIEIISKTPEFHALHWEAMQDPKLPRPLAVDCIMVRKSVKPTSTSAYVQPSPVINLLVVTARPNEEHDVSYRTISRPLLELIDSCQLRVNVELLRPGTYEALSKHLEEKGAGFYHVIHFDCHGALMQYNDLEKGGQANRYIYQQRWGRYDLQPYDSVKAFLFLEGESQGKADPVEAQELAELLMGKGIPVCILNACQSGKQVRGDKGDEGEKEDFRETSLGSRLMTAGMQMVVAMGYSVTVSAAKIMMEQLYRHVFDNKPITEAIRLSRRELFMQKGRRAYFNQTIDLEDWLLPVVYTNKKVNFNLREFTPQEEEEYFASVGSKFRFSQPEYSFFGRDLEILKIEKSLLRHNILLLQGMGGTGKTTLLNYLREWWQITNFTRDVFYFGYDEKAWTLTQILFKIGQKVYTRFESAQFQAMNQTAQVPKLVAKLRAESYILILDNLESVTGQPLAIQNTLPEIERNQIKDFLTRLVGSKTRVVLGSRSREEWLQATTFKNNIYELLGLDKEARSDLAQAILQRHVAQKNIPAIQQDTEFQKLMELLAGYPLAMEVVLINLKTQSPTEILFSLQTADVDLDSGSSDKTKSIIKCVEYSHSNLSPQAQKLLLCLAPFSKFISRHTIPLYIKQLQKLEPFKDENFEKIDEAIQEAINWGLLSPLNLNPSSGKRGEDDSPLLTIQPIFPYFLKTKLGTVETATHEALQEGFKNHYQDLAEVYNELMESKEPEKRQLGRFFCQVEYENLYNALQICLDKFESISIYFCLEQYFDLITDNQSNLKLAEMMCQRLENYPKAFIEGSLGYQILLAVGNHGNYQLKTQQYQQAKESYEKNLKLIDALQGAEEREKQLWKASIYHNLGIVAQELREFEQARNHYQQALQITIEYGNRYSYASTYHQLGIVAQELREFEQARSHYQQALQITIEYADRYSCASIYHQLGKVAQELREFEQARSHYQQALEINIEYADRYSCASTYHQLGNVAQELREFEQARSHYQQALQITIEYADRYSCASIYHQLGIVAQELREFEQARSHYQQALEINIEYGDRYSCARTYHQLGNVAQKLREFEQARSHYQQALQIKIEYGDRYSCARTYHQLGYIAQELREFEQARSHYQQALQIYIESSDRYSCARTYHQLGYIAQELREFEQARSHYQQALQIYIESSDRYECARTYHQLGYIAQELREFEQARSHYQQALQIYIESGDRYECASTYHQLGRVAQDLREYEQARCNYQQALQIYIESGDRYECASIYHNLGLLAEAEENYLEAKANLQKALEIYVEYQDEYWAAVVRELLEKLPE